MRYHACRRWSRLFQSLVRAYKRSDLYFPGSDDTKTGCFNPSFGLTSVPTTVRAIDAGVSRLFQSLVRAYKRSDHAGVQTSVYSAQVFQSLVRAYKRSDSTVLRQQERMLQVSIPRSGLQAFRRSALAGDRLCGARFNPSFGLTSVPTMFS